MGKDVWWDRRSDWETRTEPDLTTDQQRRNAILDLASRCILVEDLPENVTPQTIGSSMDQFGSVLGVKLLKGSVDQKFTGRAVVELKSTEEKLQVRKQHDTYLHMLGGMPRPVCTVEVTPALLIDHPWRRNPNLATVRTISKSDRSHLWFQKLQEMERLVIQKQDDEQELSEQLRQEEKARQIKQETEVMETMEKVDMISTEQKNGSLDEVRKLHGLCDGLKQQNVQF